jgi:hypothetical protein
MKYKYDVGDWIAFSTWRAAGTINEHILAIEPIMYTTIDQVGGRSEPAYVTSSGRIVREASVLEARRKLL